MRCRCVSDYNTYVEADAVVEDDLADGELANKHIQLAIIQPAREARGPEGPAR